MQCCWKQNPKERPTMAQIVKWSKQAELKSLRTILPIESKHLHCVCQCHINHINQNAANKLLKFQSTIANCVSFTPLFSSLSKDSPQTKSRHFLNHHAKTINAQHIQIWIAHSENGASKLTIITFRSCDLGYWVSSRST